MEQIESLKQSLKTEVHNRKQMEDQFMSMVELKTKAIEEAHTVNYMNNMY